MMNAKKVKKFVRYSNFHITNAASKYNLHVNGFTGTLADALKGNNMNKFSTFGSGNDNRSDFNCASLCFGSWWFDNDCFGAPLNGKYYSGGKMAIVSHSKNILSYTGIHWPSTGFNGGSDSLIFTEIKVRRKL